MGKAGKAKGLANKEAYQRINYLYQAAHLCLHQTPSNPEMCRFYINTLKSVAEKHVIRLLQNVPVTGPFMRAKAEEISRTLGIVDWKCGDGWLTRFKKRHNIVFTAVCGARESFHEVSTDAWVKDVLKPTLRWYRPADVFSAHETGVYWRVLPDKIHAFKDDKCYGGKKSKERITVLVCANMDGTEKMPLFTIGKFEKPQCFRGTKCLPVKYRANRKAWMDSTLFNDWLLNFDKKMAAENRKVLLVIENSPAHPKTYRHLKATELLYLPPSATCKLQPCDQGVIENLKVHYRKLLLMKMICHADGDADAANFQITLLDALSDLKLAWDMVTASTIKNCFLKACFTADKEAEESRKAPGDQGEEQPSTSNNVTGTLDYPSSGGNTEPLLERLLKVWNISPSEYLSVDKDIMTSGPKETVKCTCKCMSATATSQDSDSDYDDCGEVEETVTRTEVLEHVHKTNIYLMQTEGQGAVMKAFYQFREALERHVARLGTQTKITQFFSKSRTQRKQIIHMKCEVDERE